MQCMDVTEGIPMMLRLPMSSPYHWTHWKQMFYPPLPPTGPPDAADAADAGHDPQSPNVIHHSPVTTSFLDNNSSVNGQQQLKFNSKCKKINR